jgi:hypothetical protein
MNYTRGARGLIWFYPLSSILRKSYTLPASFLFEKADFSLVLFSHQGEGGAGEMPEKPGLKE